MVEGEGIIDRWREGDLGEIYLIQVGLCIRL
jgi:hypothetical protein